MTTAAAELETEVRRLRIRIISLTTAQLDEAVPRAPSRRAAIREALTEFGDRPDARPSALGDQNSPTRSSPPEHGQRSAQSLPGPTKPHRYLTGRPCVRRTRLRMGTGTT